LSKIERERNQLIVQVSSSLPDLKILLVAIGLLSFCNDKWVEAGVKLEILPKGKRYMEPLADFFDLEV
jgi:hypothetical protein